MGSDRANAPRWRRMGDVQTPAGSAAVVDHLAGDGYGESTVLPVPGEQFSGAKLPLMVKSSQVRMRGCWVPSP